MAFHKQNAWPIADTLGDVRCEDLRHRKAPKLSLYTVALRVYKLMEAGETGIWGRQCHSVQYL
jgi:hypothetical protein